MNTAEKIRLPDDCTIGYIIESVLGVPLTRSNLFHSHLENLQQVSRSEIHKQVTCFFVCFLSCAVGLLRRSSRRRLNAESRCMCADVFAYAPCLSDHPELWDVRKQEQHHQSERGVSCRGGSIEVRRWSERRRAQRPSARPTPVCFVFQVQVGALSPVPRHPLVSPPGCLLGRPLLSHPRPRCASVSERLAGTNVTVWLLCSCCSGVRSLSRLLLGCCAARRTTPTSCLEPGPCPLTTGVEDSGQEVAFSVKLLQAIGRALL